MVIPAGIPQFCLHRDRASPDAHLVFPERGCGPADPPVRSHDRALRILSRHLGLVARGDKFRLRVDGSPGSSPVTAADWRSDTESLR
jgi:hypothetical protein